MSEIRFYHLERQSLEQVLPTLLSKATEGGKRVIVKTADKNETERLNDHLWTYRPDSFLPHGSEKDGNPEQQPIWLTDTDENPNGADILILTGGVQSAKMKDFSLCCEMLDGHDEHAVQEARKRWKAYKDEGFDITYWQQGDKGWEKKSG